MQLRLCCPPTTEPPWASRLYVCTYLYMLSCLCVCILRCAWQSMCTAIYPPDNLSLYLPLSAPLFERMDPRTDSQRRRQQKDMHSLGNRSFHLYSNISDTKGHTKTGARTGMDSDTKGHTKTQTHTDAHTRTQRPALLLTIHTCMNPDASRHTCTCTCV